MLRWSTSYSLGTELHSNLLSHFLLADVHGLLGSLTLGERVTVGTTMSAMMSC